MFSFRTFNSKESIITGIHLLSSLLLCVFISIYPVDTDPVLHSQINVISKIQSARSLSTTSLKLNQKRKDYNSHEFQWHKL